MRKSAFVVPIAVLVGTSLLHTTDVASQFRARDPGVRGGSSGAGGALPGLSPKEIAFFLAGKADFEEAEEIDEGLGPTMNLDGCGGCHSQPAIGGTSPAVNPQVAFANLNGMTNRVPSFIRSNGPIREARFVRNADGSADGGVHALFTIAGSPAAPGCRLAQPDFERQVSNRNVVFRIPSPVFGAGLIEQIPDSVILANQASDLTAKRARGVRGKANFSLSGRTVSGQANNNGNDGTIARFGWKAQNQSLLLFSGEAYNVEMGITNELFQVERDESPACQFAPVPNDFLNTNATTPLDAVGAIEKFAVFQRFLAPPTPSTISPGGSDSIANGRNAFTSVGCAMCHTPSMRTGNSSVAALRNKSVNLFSDLLVHDMGPGLADGITQGQAGPSEFRTAPLWGLGQRIFFLHDGRTSDLMEAIAAHRSGSDRGGDASEANDTIDRFNDLGERTKQDLLNFLRSL
ncbi:di-heme oxidoredictase family protein [Usitatibacter palustris]|uniref:Cytochrome c domain-containing protein n=1 Tax=Usitatibacter palustris TaxID=2732487 RepID=A0A6M4H3E4_9PROT|nr:di-heme oxidoredictase family protein [Usitatibacter palustris]QJR14121.1 hypothetical protein DSM104440_00914 [Usitatibacter palustris]